VGETEVDEGKVQVDDAVRVPSRKGREQRPHVCKDRRRGQITICGRADPGGGAQDGDNLADVRVVGFAQNLEPVENFPQRITPEELLQDVMLG
jgi:hypothetical protein